MIPARDFAVEPHGFTVSFEQARELLDGRIGAYWNVFAADLPAWQKARREAYQQIMFDSLLAAHRSIGVEQIHLSYSHIRAQYPHAEIITTSEQWWDLSDEMLHPFGVTMGHGRPKQGFYQRTVDYRYFSAIEEGEWCTERKLRLGDPIYRLITIRGSNENR